MIIADADIWIDFFKNPASPSGQLLGNLLQDDRVGLVGMVLAEILRGSRTEMERRELMEVLDGIPYLETERSAWKRVGSVAQALDAAVQPLAVPDVIIAAIALEGGHEILTRNKHFERIPGLRLYNQEEA